MSIIFSPYCCSGKEIGEQMFSKLLETCNILEFWGWQLFAVTELAVKAAAAAEVCARGQVWVLNPPFLFWLPLI